MSSCEDIAAAWLSGTDFAGNRAAANLLGRAISPRDFDLERESLPVTAAADPITSSTILELLQRGQVPTMAAIRTLTAQNEMRKEAERVARLGRRAQRWIDDFGRLLATVAEAHWLANGIGPTRRDVLGSAPVATLIHSRVGEIAPNAVKHLWLIERAQRAGWIAYGDEPGSLCAARRFHSAQYGDRVSGQPITLIGRTVARHIARVDGRPWPELATRIRDGVGVPIFHDAADAVAQQRWLTIAGWITVDSDRAAPGHRGRRALGRRSR
ncbi:hypothetical protein GV794_26570 [Nocardia cyriacigeorgica]|uniref:DUF222 domain-containing protein n=1 Tax=Nocardia cyriacigeorgica TaxID=135487 RepID=A0ABX0CRQ8_9NOCA|nr:hypothetical protein [Nocardia cyriacigeorgica]NEW59171.1 hypothetical protein [Nocardia cyriacigeorgica]